MQTLTDAVEVDVEPAGIFSILTDPSRIPLWASDFADSAEHVSGIQWKMAKRGTAFLVDVDADPARLTVDYLRKRGPHPAGAYIRVLPGPVRGAVIVMTVPLPVDRTLEQVRAAVFSELTSLARLCSQDKG